MKLRRVLIKHDEHIHTHSVVGHCKSTSDHTNYATLKQHPARAVLHIAWSVWRGSALNDLHIFILSNPRQWQCREARPHESQIQTHTHKHTENSHSYRLKENGNTNIGQACSVVLLFASSSTITILLRGMDHTLNIILRRRTHTNTRFRKERVVAKNKQPIPFPLTTQIIDRTASEHIRRQSLFCRR